MSWGQHWAPSASVTSLEPVAPSGIFRKQPGKWRFPGLPSLFAIWREVSEWHFLPLNFSKRPTTRYSGVLRPILTPDASDRKAARCFCLCSGDILSLRLHLEFPLWNASPSLFTCVLGSFLRFTWLLKHYSSCSSSSGSKINHRPVAQTCTCPTGTRLSRQMDVGKPGMWFRKAILLEYLLSGSLLSQSTPKRCGFTSPKETCQRIVFPADSWQLKLWRAEARLKVSPAQFSFRDDRL